MQREDLRFSETEEERERFLEALGRGGREEGLCPGARSLGGKELAWGRGLGRGALRRRVFTGERAKKPD